MTSPAEIPARDLIEIARQAGFADFNERRLAEAHRAGLLPKPRTVHPGSGGSRSLYPTGTERQLIAMLEAKRLDRRNDAIAWRLWMAGFRVDDGLIRARLARAARELDAVATEAHAALADEDALEALLREAESTDLDGLAAHARALLGKDDFTTFAYFSLLVMAGGFEKFDEPQFLLPGELSPEAIVEHGIGAGRARTDALAGIEPWLAEGLGPSLAKLSSIFLTTNFSAAIQAADAAAFDAARRTVAPIVTMVPRAGEIIERQHGEGAFGAWMMKAVGNTNLDQQAQFICLLVAAQSQCIIDAEPQAAEKIADAIREGLAAEAQAAALAEQVPALRPLLDPRRIGEALRTEGGIEGLQAEVESVAEEHRAEIDGWAASTGSRG